MKRTKEEKFELDFMCLMMRIYLHSKSRCHESAFMLFKGLEKLGYDVKLKHGVYIYKDKKIKHSNNIRIIYD